MKGLEIKKEGAHGNGRPSLNSCINGEINTHLRYENYVPLDYIKARIVGIDLEPIISTLNFSEPVNTDTGEIILKRYPDGTYKNHKRYAQWFNLNFILQYSKREKCNILILEGSLHTFSNRGQHNYNDFTIESFLGVLRAFRLFLGVLPINLFIYQLEWGVNIKPVIPTNVILEHCLMFHWKEFKTPYAQYKQGGNRLNYLLKIYNKANHFDLNSELFRIERKQIDWRAFCKKQGIQRTLEDLILNDFVGLKATLIKNWNEVLFYDPLINPIDTKLRDVFYWKMIKSKTKRSTHSEKRRKLKELSATNGGDIQNKISQAISDKITELNEDKFTLSELVFSPNMLTPEFRILTRHYGFTA